jgi:hypothetical protein
MWNPDAYKAPACSVSHVMAARFDVFVAGETISWQVLLQGSKHIRLAGCQILPVLMMVQPFPVEILHNFRVLCAVCGRALLCSGITPSLRPGKFLDQKMLVTALTPKRYKFSKWVTMLICRGYVPSAHVPRITWPWTLEPSVVHINSIWNISESGISNSMTCKLFIHLRVIVVNLP